MALPWEHGPLASHFCPTRAYNQLQTPLNLLRLSCGSGTAAAALSCGSWGGSRMLSGSKTLFPWLNHASRVSVRTGPVNLAYQSLYRPGRRCHSQQHRPSHALAASSADDFALRAQRKIEKFVSNELDRYGGKVSSDRGCGCTG